MNRPTTFPGRTRPDTPLAGRTMLYIIGGQRCGTTWLHAQLQRHPEVHVPDRKEVHYWESVRPPHLPYFRQRAARDLRRFTESSLADRYRQHGVKGVLAGHRIRRRLTAVHDALHDEGPDHGKYAALMARGSRRDAIIVDNTPAYALVGHETFAEMANVCGSAKFVFVMREPVARLWSGLGLHIKHDTGSPEEREGALRLLLREALDGDRRLDLARSDYARTISELERSIDAADVLYLFFEDLFKPATLDAICDFVGIARNASAPSLRLNANRQSSIKLGAADRAAARERLADVYGFVQGRFGDRVPEAWRA